MPIENVNTSTLDLTSNWVLNEMFYLLCYISKDEKILMKLYYKTVVEGALAVFILLYRHMTVSCHCCFGRSHLQFSVNFYNSNEMLSSTVAIITV